MKIDTKEERLKSVPLLSEVQLLLATGNLLN